MNGIEALLGKQTRTGSMERGRVLVVLDESSALIDCRGQQVCDVLQTTETPLRLATDDTVLVWIPEAKGAHAVVLGRIGPSHAEPEPTTGEETDAVPDEVVIEAGKGLTLKCGDGSITLRQDGKILIKGTDLVSRASRLNRVKGGAVSIN